MSTIYIYIQCLVAGWQHCENDNTLVMAKKRELGQAKCLGNCVAMWGCQRSMDQWIWFMVSPGFKANNKKIEGRLLREPSQILSFTTNPPHISTSPGLIVWSAAAGAKSIIPRN